MFFQIFPKLHPTGIDRLPEQRIGAASWNKDTKQPHGATINYSPLEQSDMTAF